MIEIAPRDDTERALWDAALDLAELLDGLPWTLVGAQMVMLHAFEAGVVPARTSGDLDLLFDVRALTGATEEAAARLTGAGFTEANPSIDGITHRFTKDKIVVDVLAPEGLGARASRTTVVGARTVSVPGGTQALARTVEVNVRLGGRIGGLRRPSLLGAILIKARAVDVAPGEAAKHRGDLAFLCGLVADPRALAADLSRSERGWLRDREELSGRTHPAWRSAPRPDDAFIAFTILAERP